MEYSIVYIVMNEGEVVYSSEDNESAEAYADNKGYEARERVLEEWGNDDPSEKDIAEADFQAGYDGDYYEVIEVDISGLTNDDMVELPDGSEINVSDILDKMELSDDMIEYLEDTENDE